MFWLCYDVWISLDSVTVQYTVQGVQLNELHIRITHRNCKSKKLNNVDILLCWGSFDQPCGPEKSLWSSL